MRQFAKLQNELTVSGDESIILRDHRLVIPKCLRQCAVALAHQGHFSLNNTKQLLRDKIWFHGIDCMVHSLIDACVPCQTAGQATKPQPLTLKSMPRHCFQEVNIDFLGPLLSGDYILVVADRKSRYPIAEIVKSTAAPTMIPRLHKIFASFGLPE